MFKPSSKAILVATFTFIAASALPVAFAKQGGNGHNNGSSGSTGNTSDAQGGPPACRDLQGTIDQLQTMINSLNTSIATINANVNTINSNVSTLGTRIDTINSSLATVSSRIDTMNTTLNTFSTRFDTIVTTLNTLQTDIADIQATLQAQGVTGVQADVAVNTTACTAGVSQCASTVPANSTNQNPVALNVLVTNGSTPITNLSQTSFQFAVPLTPNGQAATFQVCTNGDTGCGTGTFFVNSGNGVYQLWVSPTSNWTPGMYSGLLTINTPSGSTTQQVDFTIQ